MSDIRPESDEGNGIPSPDDSDFVRLVEEDLAAAMLSSGLRIEAFDATGDFSDRSPLRDVIDDETFERAFDSASRAFSPVEQDQQRPDGSRLWGVLAWNFVAFHDRPAAPGTPLASLAVTNREVRLSGTTVVLKDRDGRDSFLRYFDWPSLVSQLGLTVTLKPLGRASMAGEQGDGDDQ